MTYVFFFLLAISYNVVKFIRNKDSFLVSLKNANGSEERNNIISHHFHIFMFEASLGMIAALLLSENVSLGLVALGFMYVAFIGFGLYLYQIFLNYLEKHTELDLKNHFNDHFIKEFRVSFSIMFIPIVLYSILNWTFQESQLSSNNGMAFIEIILNIIFVSVLTIFCTVAIFLRLIPHREITEPEYQSIIQNRLAQIGLPHMRVKWIEADMKNAFIVGIKLWRISNQTMFIGRKLKEILTEKEFDAVVAHELSHVQNNHIQKRLIELFRLMFLIMIGLMSIIAVVMFVAVFLFNEDVNLYMGYFINFGIVLTFSWIALSFALYFDTIRSHEYEADAFAVLELGADPEALISALKKLTENSHQLPDFMQQKKNKKIKIPFFHRIGEFFSTHPSLHLREQSLFEKIRLDLSFNYSNSFFYKVRARLGGLLHWKVLGSGVVASAIVGVLLMSRVEEGQKIQHLANSLSVEELKTHPLIKKHINYRPAIMGPTVLWSIVKRKDSELIDHFINVEKVDAKRALRYVLELKDYPLFEEFYMKYENRLDQDNYYLLLHRSAELDVTDSYRLMVNTARFEKLKPEYKMNVAEQLRYNSGRKPASHP